MAELAAAKEELFALDNQARLSAQKSEPTRTRRLLGAKGGAMRHEIEGLVEKEADNARVLAELRGEAGRFDEEAEARSRELDATEHAYSAARSA